MATTDYAVNCTFAWDARRLAQIPVLASINGTQILTLPAADASILVGQTVTGVGIPSGTTVSAISTTTVTLSQPATLTTTAAPVVFATGLADGAVLDSTYKTNRLGVAVRGGSVGGTNRPLFVAADATLKAAAINVNSGESSLQPQGLTYGPGAMSWVFVLATTDLGTTNSTQVLIDSNSALGGGRLIFSRNLTNGGNFLLRLVGVGLDQDFGYRLPNDSALHVITLTISAGGSAKLYDNGVKVGSTLAMGAAPAIGGTTTLLSLPTPVNYSFRGRCAAIRFYTEELSAGNVAIISTRLANLNITQNVVIAGNSLGAGFLGTSTPMQYLSTFLGATTRCTTAAVSGQEWSLMAITAITAVDPEYDPFLNPGDNKLFVIEGVNAAYQCRAGIGAGSNYGTVAEAQTDPALVASRIRSLESNYLTLRRAATTAAGGSAQGWRYIGCLNPPYRTDLNIPTTAQFALDCRNIQIQELALRGAATQTFYDGIVDMTQTTGWRLYSEVQPTYNKLYNADGTHFTDFGYQYFATLMYWWLTVGTGFYPGTVTPSAAQIGEVLKSILPRSLAASQIPSNMAASN